MDKDASPRNTKATVASVGVPDANVSVLPPPRTRESPKEMHIKVTQPNWRQYEYCCYNVVCIAESLPPVTPHLCTIYGLDPEHYNSGVNGMGGSRGEERMG